MSINATLLGQIITFAFLVWFTMRFVWPPIIHAMRERQARISEGLAAAERSGQQLEKAQEEVESMLREARHKAQEILAQANKRSLDVVEQAKIEAKVEGERIITAARSEIEQEVNQAREQLRRELASLAIAGASRIIKRELDDNAQRALVDDLIAQL